MTALLDAEFHQIFDANKTRSLLPKLLPNWPGRGVMETDRERSDTQEVPMKWGILG
jgi:hypothetical protein